MAVVPRRQAPQDRLADVTASSTAFDVVIPTVGRSSLGVLVSSLVRVVPAGTQIIVVDDRRQSPDTGPLDLPMDDSRVRVARSGGRGPAAARNVGWQTARAPWVAYIDDDVDVPLDWVRRLEEDVRGVAPDVAAVQGRIRVPVSARRRPSDWERNVQGLEDARWATADLTVRRSALEAVGGFDERFPRAYREDADFAIRLLDAGWRLEVGDRQVRHPVRPAPWWVSVRLQRGNADDVLIERLHGRAWRSRIGAASGTYAAHRLTVVVGGVGLAALATGRRRLGGAALGWWLARTLRFAWLRIAPGPRSPGEIGAMVVSSVLIPPAACLHRALGHLRLRRT